MALEGTIQDFALPDIFQLIGIQRKTGILVLTHGQERVTIKFLEGNVVEADTASDSLESRLGTVLVRTGRITEAQRNEALEIQRDTLQRLGHILVKRGFISQEELVDALQIQSSQVIYRLFRWREGRYHFDPVEDLDYDRTHAMPLSSETILMEGARMVDEWPIIERRIPSDRVVLRRTPAGDGALRAARGEPRVEPSAEDGLDIDLGVDLDLPPEASTADQPQQPPADAEAPKLSEQERQVLGLVDGRRTVREIVDLTALPEFETFRALSEMLVRRLVERLQPAAQAKPSSEHEGVLAGILGWLGKALLAAAAAAAVVSLPSNRAAPWSLIERSPTTERLRLYASMARLERVEEAVQVFYLDMGSVPPALEALVDYGYVDGSALQDPWGRPYLFRLSPGGYQLQGRDAAGEAVAELTVSRNFSEVQRLLLDPNGAPAP